MNKKFGFLRTSAVQLAVSIGNPEENATNVARILQDEQALRASGLVVFPENVLTGYTAGDLFGQDQLLDSTIYNLERLARSIQKQVVVVGAPIVVGNGLYNCACVLNSGRVAGILHKQNLPNYKEFYEGRWFKNVSKPGFIDLGFGYEIPFGADLMFRVNDTECLISGEVCEDMFMPIPPSSYAALAGATVLFNVSASPEQVAKADYRRELVSNQSGRCMAGYIYASAGPTESSSDLVFGGHCLIYENATKLAESRRVGDGERIERESYFVSSDIDYKKLLRERRITTSFFNAEATQEYREFPVEVEDVAASGRKPGLYRLWRNVNAKPFVPSEGPALDKRCAEVFDISSSGLCQRLSRLRGPVSIGVSGGLDSTLALCSLLRSFNALGKPKKDIKAFTMPGFGTTEKTKGNAVKLAELLGLEMKTVDIRPASWQTFLDLEHQPFEINPRQVECDVKNDLQDQVLLEAMWGNGFDALTYKCIEYFERELKEKAIGKEDVVFENVQARHRTNILMNAGSVIGTGDMSEIALGWCTYNADHMSMYNPNCSIPKTLVKFLVEYVANNLTAEIVGPSRQEELKAVLLDIAGTTISPELLPRGAKGEIVHSTEEIIGPYELHDFFLFNFIRNGFPAQKIAMLAQQASGFEREYTQEEIVKWLRVFYTRFFWSQFKRNCVPDGPKVGSVSLSPRGDWRMPSDADPSIWLKDLEAV